MNIYTIPYTQDMTIFIKSCYHDKFLKMREIDNKFRFFLNKFYIEYGYLDSKLIDLAGEKSILEISK